MTISSAVSSNETINESFMLELDHEAYLAIYADSNPNMVRTSINNLITALPMDKMVAISETIFSDAFSWMNFD